jgi:hypothetical protein
LATSKKKSQNNGYISINYHAGHLTDKILVAKLENIMK